MPAPRLRGYAPETVVAEKFQAMVAFGLANSRMKDYFDVWVLSRAFDFDRGRLAAGISATFARRNTAVPRETPDGLNRCMRAFPVDTESPCGHARLQLGWRRRAPETYTVPEPRARAR